MFIKHREEKLAEFLLELPVLMLACDGDGVKDECGGYNSGDSSVTVVATLFRLGKIGSSFNTCLIVVYDDSPASDSEVLGLEACTTIPTSGFWLSYDSSPVL